MRGEGKLLQLVAVLFLLDNRYLKLSTYPLKLLYK